jgi:hypothetical protein
MNRIKPVFIESSFSFTKEAPEHIEAYTRVPNYIGMYAVFGSINGGERTYLLASDIDSYETAKFIADARVKQQEGDISIYGYTDDVYISEPDGNLVKVYSGRKEIS